MKKPSEKIKEIAYQNAYDDAPRLYHEHEYATSTWDKEPYISKAIIQYLDERCERDPCYWCQEADARRQEPCVTHGENK